MPALPDAKPLSPPAELLSLSSPKPPSMSPSITPRFTLFDPLKEGPPNPFLPPPPKGGGYASQQSSPRLQRVRTSPIGDDLVDPAAGPPSPRKKEEWAPAIKIGRSSNIGMKPLIL